jgi:hypothetical protein
MSTDENEDHNTDIITFFGTHNDPDLNGNQVRIHRSIEIEKLD